MKANCDEVMHNHIFNHESLVCMYWHVPKQKQTKFVTYMCVEVFEHHNRGLDEQCRHHVELHWVLVTMLLFLKM
jgi:hypothetical protein